MPPFSSFLIFSPLYLRSKEALILYLGFIYITFFGIINGPFSSRITIGSPYSFPYSLPSRLHLSSFSERSLEKAALDINMGSGSSLLHIFTLLFLQCLLLSSGSSVPHKDPAQGTKEKGKHGGAEQRMLLSSEEELDDVPIVNPTAPGTGPTTPASSPPPPATTTPAGPSGAWCVASSTASPTALQVALDYACGYGGADCSTIQPGGSCYNPNTLKDHASYAFNDYYQKNPAPTSCVFGGTAQLTNTDPSNGNCHYASSSATSVSPPATLTPPVMMSPPISMAPPYTMTPPYSTVPGSPVFGSAEPTGLPSSSNSLHSSLVLLLATTSLICLLLSGANP